MDTQFESAMPDDNVLESLDRSIEKINSRRRLWLLGIFLLTSSPGVFNAYHIMVSVFLSHIPPHWCQVEALDAANWTTEQIRNISSPSGTTGSSCSFIGWNYTQLADMGYEAALAYATSHPAPPTVPCFSYSYDEDVPHSSTVSEWDLVCDRLPLKSSVQSSIAIGKFVGGFLFGFIADKYGRKSSFMLACLTYIVTGPLAAFSPSYWLFIVARFFIGTAGSGCYESAYTLLTELASKDRRSTLGCVYNMAYPVGYITLPLIALLFPAWRTLQLAVSLPMLFLLIHCWLLPESPRWLMTQGRQIEAWGIVKSIDDSAVPPQFLENVTNIQDKPKAEDSVEGPHVPLIKRILDGIRKLFVLFTTPELCRRICIAYFTWFVAALSYYVLALNADNFSSNRYIYLALTGLVEAPSYILPLLIMVFLGRKSTAALLFLVSGLALISILLIPQENGLMILIVALLGRFADSAVFAVIILHTSELFPTSSRNTAIGTSLAISQLGSISAPYVVDILGKYAWYMPSTLCGGLALSSVVLTLVLPETRGKPLMDTAQDLDLAHHRDRVSCSSQQQTSTLFPMILIWKFGVHGLLSRLEHCELDTESFYQRIKMKVPTVHYCCCGLLSLKLGTLLIGILDFVGSIGSFFNTLDRFNDFKTAIEHPDMEDPDIVRIREHFLAVQVYMFTTFIVTCIQAVLATVMLTGYFTNNRSMLRTWVVGAIFLLVISFVSNLSMTLLFEEYIYVIFEFAVFINLYFICVVHSYSQEMIKGLSSNIA